MAKNGEENGEEEDYDEEEEDIGTAISETRRRWMTLSFLCTSFQDCGRFAPHPHPALRFFDSTENRSAVAELLVHVADIGAMLMKPSDQALKWGLRIAEEFVAQGDSERARVRLATLKEKSGGNGRDAMPRTKGDQK